jgi:hypothetical protein
MEDTLLVEEITVSVMLKLHAMVKKKSKVGRSNLSIL